MAVGTVQPKVTEAVDVSVEKGKIYIAQDGGGKKIEITTGRDFIKQLQGDAAKLGTASSRASVGKTKADTAVRKATGELATAQQELAAKRKQTPPASVEELAKAEGKVKTAQQKLSKAVLAQTEASTTYFRAQGKAATAHGRVDNFRAAVQAAKAGDTKGLASANQQMDYQEAVLGAARFAAPKAK